MSYRKLNISAKNSEEIVCVQIIIQAVERKESIEKKKKRGRAWDWTWGAPPFYVCGYKNKTASDKEGIEMGKSKIKQVSDRRPEETMLWEEEKTLPVSESAMMSYKNWKISIRYSGTKVSKEVKRLPQWTHETRSCNGAQQERVMYWMWVEVKNRDSYGQLWPSGFYYSAGKSLGKCNDLILE